MTRNMGTLDRIVRLVIVAPVAAYLAFTLGGIAAIVLGAVAAIMALTAIVGSCPLYRLVGLNTCPLDKRGATPQH